MSDHTRLPTELWLEIFDWATSDRIHVPEHAPFRPLPDSGVDPKVRVRARIALVCRAWRAWVAQSLYKDIRISTHGAHALQRALETELEQKDSASVRYGDTVRRVVLPYQSTSTVATSNQKLQSLEILRLCPHIHILQRPLHLTIHSLRFDFEVENVALPSLQRLEWWHFNEAERSGGINSLGAVMRNAPQLRYLFIGGIVGSHFICMEPGNIVLPHLETLHLHVRSGLLLRQIIDRWTLPSLKHVILETPIVHDGEDELWETFGGQLDRIELGRHVRFSMVDVLTPCLNSCPNLKELDYYIFFTKPPEGMLQHSNLNRIGLHAHVNGMLKEGASAWNLIEHHFELLCGENLPALQEIILYGDWKPILRHHRFGAIKEMLLRSQRSLRLSNQNRLVS